MCDKKSTWNTKKSKKFLKEEKKGKCGKDEKKIDGKK